MISSVSALHHVTSPLWEISRNSTLPLQWLNSVETEQTHKLYWTQRTNLVSSSSWDPQLTDWLWSVQGVCTDSSLPVKGGREGGKVEILFFYILKIITHRGEIIILASFAIFHVLQDRRNRHFTLLFSLKIFKIYKDEMWIFKNIFVLLLRSRFALMIYRKTNFSIIFAVEGPRQGSLCLSSISVCTFLSQFCQHKKLIYSKVLSQIFSHRLWYWIVGWNFRIFLCIFVEQVIVNNYLWTDMWLLKCFFLVKDHHQNMFGHKFIEKVWKWSLMMPEMFYFLSLP